VDKVGAGREGQETEDGAFPADERRQASEVFFRVLWDLLGVEVKALE
jgi:hypothetical protein